MKILWYPEPILFQPAGEVEEIDGALAEQCGQMIETMHEAKGVGLAGPQVGLGLRVAVLNLAGTPGEAVTAVNPAILEREGLAEAEEGCLSFPALFTKIARSARVLVAFYDLDGTERRFEAEGLAARVWQHELDHLDGILIVDRMTSVRRLAAARRLRELEADYEQSIR